VAALRASGAWELDFRTVVSIGPMPVESVRPESEAAARDGLVNLAAGGYLLVSVEDGEIWFRLVPGSARLFDGPCARTAQGNSCPVPVTRQINGVAPTEGGTLYLRFQ
jgi:hypothetical protein